jgi:hypothetical protein
MGIGTRWVTIVAAGLALLGGAPPAAAAPVTFQSDLALRVYAVVAVDDPYAETDCIAGDLVNVGETPSEHALEVPRCLTWFVAPKDTRIGSKQARAIAADAATKGVPGLSFQGCEGLGDQMMRDVAGHRGLRYLDLRETNVTIRGLGLLRKHPALTWLDIADRQPEDMSWLSGMPKLQATDVSGAWLAGAGGLAGPGGARKLETLVARRASSFAASALFPLRGARSLRRLYLGENTNLDDTAVPALVAVPALEHVELARCSITDASFRALADCKRLVSLDLSFCKITGSGLSELASAKKLTRLVLRNTEVGDASAPTLAGLSNLRAIDVSDTDFTDAGVEALVAHGALEELHLEDCNGVTVAAIPHLEKMKTLRVLVVRGTGIPRQATRKLAQALPRCDVR